MKHKLTTQEIARLLDQHAEQIDARTAERLAQARRHALKYQQSEAQTPLLIWAQRLGLVHTHTASGHKATHWGIASLLLILLLGGVLYWQQAMTEHEHEHVDIDLQILIDDLPVDMYVDE